MATEVSAVIECAFDKMKECDFMKMSREDAETVLKLYVRSACVAYSDSRGVSLTLDKGLETFKEDLTEEEIDLLGSYVCLKYIDANYVRTTLMMKPFLSGTDFHSYANKDMLAQVMEAQERFKTEIRESCILRSYRDKSAPFWHIHERRR